MADIKDIVAKIGENKELLGQIAKADPSQAVGLLKKININVEESDIKKIQDVIAGGSLDIGKIKDIASGFLK